MDFLSVHDPLSIFFFISSCIAHVFQNRKMGELINALLDGNSDLRKRFLKDNVFPDDIKEIPLFIETITFQFDSTSAGEEVSNLIRQVRCCFLGKYSSIILCLSFSW